MNKTDFRIGMTVQDSKGRHGKVINIRESSIVYNLDSGGMESGPFNSFIQVPNSINKTIPKVDTMRPETLSLLESKSRQYGVPLPILNRAWLKGMSTWNGKGGNPHQHAAAMVQSVCESGDWEMQRRAAVQKEIDKDPRIGRKEAQKIHALLRTVKPQGPEQTPGSKKRYQNSIRDQQRDEESHGGGGNQTSGNDRSHPNYVDGLGYKNGPAPAAIGESVDEMFESLLIGTDESARTMRAMTPGEKGYDPEVHLRRNPEFGNTSYGHRKPAPTTIPVRPVVPSADTNTGYGNKGSSKGLKVLETQGEKKKLKKEDNTGLGPQVDVRSPAGQSASPGGGIGPGASDIREGVVRIGSLKQWSVRHSGYGIDTDDNPGPPDANGVPLGHYATAAWGRTKREALKNFHAGIDDMNRHTAAKGIAPYRIAKIHSIEDRGRIPSEDKARYLKRGHVPGQSNIKLVEDIREDILPRDAGIRAWAMRPDIQNLFAERYGRNSHLKLAEAAHRMYNSLKEDGTPKKSFSKIKKKFRKEDALGTAGSGSTGGTTRPPFG